MSGDESLVPRPTLSVQAASATPSPGAAAAPRGGGARSVATLVLRAPTGLTVPPHARSQGTGGIFHEMSLE